MDDATPPNPAPAGSSPKGLVERAKDILISPKTEWGVIESEASSVQSIYTTYIVILAAITPIAMVIGQVLMLGMPAGYAVTGAVLNYLIVLGGVYVAALVIDALAPTFKGTKNFLNAFKVAAYSGTAMWLAGIFWVLPQLIFLAIVGLYSFYLLYLGLPRLMKVQQDQAVAYVGIVIVVQLVIYVIAGTIVWRLAASLFTPVYPGVIIVT